MKSGDATSDERLAEKRASVPRLLASGVLCGWFFFLYLFCFELILNYWFSKKLPCSKVAYLVGTYAVIGALCGAGLAGALAIARRLISRRFGIETAPLFVALSVSGFVFVPVYIVLNACYLPQSRILSLASLSISLALALLCIPLVRHLHTSTRASGASAPVSMTMGIGASVAVAAAVFHALVSRRIGTQSLDFLEAAGLAAAFLLTCAFVAAVDAKVMGLIAGGASNGVRRIRWMLFAKVIAGGAALAIILFARAYRPLSAPGGGSRPSTPSLDRPNIIVIVLDTVRRDRLSVYGNRRDVSPRISEFAKQSSIFNAYSPSSWTLPAHASIVTGLYPTENGTGRGRNYLIDPENETLAEILRDNGYSTAAVIANHFVLGRESGFAQGFDYYHADSRETDPAFSFIAAFVLKKLAPDSRFFAFMPFTRAEGINRKAMRWLEKNREDPFLLFLNYMDAHAPYVPPAPHDGRIEESPPANFFGADGIWKSFVHEVNEGRRAVADRERRYLLAQYDGEIAYLDSQIGAFFEELKEIGVFDDSLIILTSDHGELFAEHGLVHHPRVLFQELIRVPLIVKPPALKTTETWRMPEAVSLTDLFPSILGFAGVAHEARHGSGNMFGGESSAIFSETHSMRGESGPEFLKRFGEDQYSVVLSNYKLIYSSNRTYEMYDLATDPTESHNLLTEDIRPETESALFQMQSELGSWIARLQAGKLESSELPPDERDEIRSRLKALGYIQ